GSRRPCFISSPESPEPKGWSYHGANQTGGSTWLYSHRIAGGDRHHRRVDRHAAAGGAKSPRGGVANAVPEQLPSNWPRVPQLRQQRPRFPQRRRLLLHSRNGKSISAVFASGTVLHGLWK